MRKVWAILLICMLCCIGCTGCGSEEKPTAQQSQSNSEQTGVSETDEAVDASDEDSKAQDTDEDADEADKADKTDADDQKTPADSTVTPNAPSSAGKPATGNKKPSSAKDEEEEKAEAPSGTPAEIIDAVYEEKPVDLALATTELDISDSETLKAFTGISSGDQVKAAAVSEALINSQAYSMVVVRVKKSKNMEAIAKEMRDGINPAKWVCVEADDVRVAGYDDLILLIMVSSDLEDTVTGKEIVKAFKKVCGGSLDVSLKR